MIQTFKQSASPGTKNVWVPRSEASCWSREIWAEQEEDALSSSSPPLLTGYANCLPSCPLLAHCTVASADLLSTRCPTQARDTVYWKGFCLYLIPLSFRRLKAWPPCCLTHHSLPPPTSLSTPAVRFPGDPHSLATWPGWSSVRVGQGGSRQGYRLQPSCMRRGHRLPECYPFTPLSATGCCT